MTPRSWIGGCAIVQLCIVQSPCLLHNSCGMRLACGLIGRLCLEAPDLALPVHEWSIVSDISDEFFHYMVSLTLRHRIVNGPAHEQCWRKDRSHRRVTTLRSMGHALHARCHEIAAQHRYLNPRASYIYKCAQVCYKSPRI